MGEGAFMSTRAPLSKTTSLAAFADTLRALGAPVDSALGRARLPIGYADRPDAWVSYHAMRRFMGDLCTREALDDLGARAALHASERGIHPTLLKAVYAAPTLHYGVCTIARMVTIQSSHLRVWTELYEDGVRLCVRHPLGPSYPGYEAIESFTTRQLVTMLRHFCDPEWLPARVVTRVARWAHGRAWSEAPFAEDGVPVVLHDGHAGFDIPADILATRNREPVRAMASPGPSAPPTTVAEAVRSCMAPYLSEGKQSLELAAEVVGLSKRSLQRALAEEDTTFRKVVALSRLDCALSDIEDLDLPLAEIALRLGYSEPSAFSRAFRAWVGMSPRAYRALLRARSGGGGEYEPLIR